MRTKPSTRVWPPRLTIALAGLVLAGAIAVHAPAVAAAATPAPNPGWPSCQANIAVLLDRSSSVGYYKPPTILGDPNNVGLVKNAATTFLGSFQSVPDGPSFFVNTFATYAKTVYAPGGTFNRDFRGAQQAVSGIPFRTSATMPADYGPPPGFGGTIVSASKQGLTNWQGALAAVPKNANLVVMVTDGEPTWYNTANNATNNDERQKVDLDQAVMAANDLKRNGTRVVVVHVGGIDEQRRADIVAVSGPVLGEDYFEATFGNVNAVLQGLASKACRPEPRISVTRTLSPATATLGQTVTVTVTVRNTGNVSLTNVWTQDDSQPGPFDSCGNLAPSQTCTRSGTFTVPMNAPSGMRTEKAWGRANFGPTVVAAEAWAGLRIRPPIVPT